ncbi:hypothetical protein M3J09_000010 [Ascochyta lentis]
MKVNAIIFPAFAMLVASVAASPAAADPPENVVWDSVLKRACCAPRVCREGGCRFNKCC